MKNKIKILLAFIIGMLVSGISVYAVTTLYKASEVSYDNTNSNTSVTEVQSALDELYEKAKEQSHATTLIATNISSYEITEDGYYEVIATIGGHQGADMSMGIYVDGTKVNDETTITTFLGKLTKGQKVSCAKTDSNTQGYVYKCAIFKLDYEKNIELTKLYYTHSSGYSYEITEDGYYEIVGTIGGHQGAIMTTALYKDDVIIGGADTASIVITKLKAGQTVSIKKADQSTQGQIMVGAVYKVSFS